MAVEWVLGCCLDRTDLKFVEDVELALEGGFGGPVGLNPRIRRDSRVGARDCCDIVFDE